MGRLKHLDLSNLCDGGCDKRFDAPLIRRDQRRNSREGIAERISRLLSWAERKALGLEVSILDSQVENATIQLTIFLKSIDEFLEQTALVRVVETVEKGF